MGSWVETCVGALAGSLLVPGFGSVGCGAGGFLLEVVLLLLQPAGVGHLSYPRTYLYLLHIPLVWLSSPSLASPGYPWCLHLGHPCTVIQDQPWLRL